MMANDETVDILLFGLGAYGYEDEAKSRDLIADAILASVRSMLSS